MSIRITALNIKSHNCSGMMKLSATLLTQFNVIDWKDVN